jgi:hypothetical protein
MHFKRRFLPITIFRISIIDLKVVSISCVFLRFLRFFSIFLRKMALFSPKIDLASGPQNRPSAERRFVLSHPSPELREADPRSTSIASAIFAQGRLSTPTVRRRGLRSLRMTARMEHPFFRGELAGLCRLHSKRSRRSCTRRAGSTISNSELEAKANREPNGFVRIGGSDRLADN